MAMSLSDGQVVTLEYTVRLEDGTLVDSTGECGPLSVMYGSGQLFPALEDRLGEMVVGETLELRIPADDAFGAWHADLVRSLPRDSLPPDLDLREGGDYGIKGPDGRRVRFRVRALRGNEVQADFNDPRAGQALLATVTLVAVRPPTPDEERRGRV
jgi:FKBP-type peptidyl-prolyl cis-trans isomerase 2